MFRRNLGLQLLALYLIFVVPVLVGAWVFGSDASARLEQDVQDNDLILARTVALETDVFIDNALNTVEQLASLPQVQNLEVDQLAHVFAPITVARSEVNLVYVLDAQGIMLYHYPEAPGSTVGQDFSTRQYFKDALTARAPLLSIGRISPTTGQPVATAVMPVRDAAGNFRGVVATNLALNQLSLPLKEIAANRADRQRVSILDASGQIIADSDATKLLTDAHAEFPLEANAVLRGETDSLVSPDGVNREWLRSYAPILSGKWGVVVQRPADLALALPRAFRVQLIIAVGVFLASGLLFWLMLSRRVIAPLEALAVFSTAIGKRAVVPADRVRLASYTTRGDQVGGLTRAVTQMERDIERRIEEQATLLQTSAAVSSSLDIEKVLNTILDQVQRLLGVQTCAILTVDERAAQLHAPAARGLSDVFLRGIRTLNDDEKALLPAIRAGGVIKVGDVETALGLTVSTRERARAEGHRAFVMAPLVTPHAPLAALVVYWREPHTFSPEEIALITAFAHQAAMALENAALFARIDEKLRESEERWRRLSDAAFEGIAIHDDGKFIDANQVFAAMFGYAHDEIVGMNALDLAAPESRDQVRQNILAGSETPYEAIGLRKDGTTFISELRGKPIPYQGRLVRVVTLRDITARKQAESELRRLHMAVDDSSEAIFLTDREGIITFINPEFTRLYGFSADEVIGKTTPRILKSGKMRAEEYQFFWQTLLSKQVVKGELVNKTKDGRYITVECSANPILDEQGVIVGFLGIQRDITDRKQMEEQLKQTSIHDALTGLYNRRFLEEEMTRLERGRQFPVSIVMADLNNLKKINDSAGHAAGDALIQRAAQVLTAAFRADDIIARIGGDEFAVLLPNTDAASAAQLLARVRHALSKHNAARGGTPLSIAFGVSTAPLGGALTETLKEADARMYKEKHGNDPKTTSR